MKKSDIAFLEQLVESLGEAGVKLQQAYEKKDVVNFNRAKKFILHIQKKISEVAR